MSQHALAYLLQSRENRGRPDHFARDVVLCGLVLWLTCLLLGTRQWGGLAFITGTGTFVLSLVTIFLAISFPMREVQKDASLHASLYGGRCYDEVLGSRIRPTEMVDQIALHSMTTCLRASSRWVGLVAVLWCLLAPGWFLHVLLASLVWFPLVAAFVLPTSYLAQQLSIYHSQLKSGMASSFIDSGLGVMTGGPMGIFLLLGFLSSLWQNFLLTFCFALAYLVFGVIVSRRVAIAGIERLPKVRERIQELSRRWRVVRRNPWVRSWSQNPIVVRERARDAGRIPGHFLGAVIFQAPLFFATLLFHWCFGVQEIALQRDSGPFYSSLILFGIIQFTLASRRASGAIVGEVVSQTMEPMQNTRLHAREFLFGWLQVAAVPRVFENLLIFIAVYCAYGATWVSVGTATLCGLIFLALPIVGGAMGLLASYAISPEKAARAHSELMLMSLFGWLAVVLGASKLIPEEASWPWCVTLALYLAGIFTFCMFRILAKIEIR